MKVLISAYACEPGEGSEPGVGWNVIKEMSKYHELCVITRSNNKDKIESYIKNTGQLKNIDFIYYDLPSGVKFWKRGRRGVQVYYYLWQIAIYFIARDLNKKIGFHLIHHVTFVKYWQPSFLSLLSVPFIWGPVGGGESTPENLRNNLKLKSKIYEKIRDIARLIGEYDPFVRLTAKRSSIVLATTNETEQRLRRLGINNSMVFSQIGLLKEEIKYLNSFELNFENKIIFLSIGNLNHIKGFDIGLRSFAACENYNAEYWIIGDGPEEEYLKKLTYSLGIDKKVKFFGKQSRVNVFEILKNAHVLVHPSLHDSGALVCMEAMAAGRPVICLDAGGPAVQVTKETGFKVSTISYESVIKDITLAMNKFINKRELIIEMGQASKKRSHEFYSWESKGKALNKFYMKESKQK